MLPGDVLKRSDIIGRAAFPRHFSAQTHLLRSKQKSVSGANGRRKSSDLQFVPILVYPGQPALVFVAASISVRNPLKPEVTE